MKLLSINTYGNFPALLNVQTPSRRNRAWDSAAWRLTIHLPLKGEFRDGRPHICASNVTVFHRRTSAVELTITRRL